MRLLYVPKVICLVAETNMFDVHKGFLLFLYKNVFYWQTVKYEPFIIISNQYLSLLHQFTQQYGLERAQQIVKLDKLSKISDQKQLQVSRNLLLNFYLSFIFSSDRLEIGNSSEVIISTPELQMNLKQEMIQLKIQKEFFSLPNFSYLTIFKKLSTKSIIDLFTAVLLERQIILFAGNQNELIQICETILAFIYPFTWKTTYIPFLPNSMLETLNACGGFIVGLSRHDKNYVYQHIDTHDKFLLDIDNDILESSETLQLPDHLLDYLEDNLTQLVKHLNKISNEQFCRQKILETELLLNLKRVFFSSMLELINNYQHFFMFSSSNTNRNSEIFSKKAYLQIFNIEDQQFMNELVNNTMMFSNFIEEAYKYQYEAKTEKLNFFVSIHNKLGLRKTGAFHLDTNQNFQIYIEPELDMMIGKAISQYSDSKKIDISVELIECILKNSSESIQTKNQILEKQNQMIGSIKSENLIDIIFKCHSQKLQTFDDIQSEVLKEGEIYKVNQLPQSQLKQRKKLQYEQSEIQENNVIKQLTKVQSEKQFIQFSKNNNNPYLVKSLQNQVSGKSQRKIFDQSCIISPPLNDILISINRDKQSSRNKPEEPVFSICGVFKCIKEKQSELVLEPKTIKKEHQQQISPPFLETQKKQKKQIFDEETVFSKENLITSQTTKHSDQQIQFGKRSAYQSVHVLPLNYIQKNLIL